MKTIILAGGMGSRLGSIADMIPKPMTEIGGKPILWQIKKNIFPLTIGTLSYA